MPNIFARVMPECGCYKGERVMDRQPALCDGVLINSPPGKQGPLRQARAERRLAAPWSAQETNGWQGTLSQSHLLAY